MSYSQRDDGVVKYQAIHQNTKSLSHPLLDELDLVRTKLFDLGLIGLYPDGIGYGNVSIRCESGCIVSGTATGDKRILGVDGYCFVRNYSIEKNLVFTEGPINASSEAMTHCAIYQADSLMQCVLHIHCKDLWEILLDQKYDSTPADILYGTPQMALSIATLVKAKAKPSNLIVMAGHDEGIIAYGQTIALAFQQIKMILPKFN